MKLKEKVRPSIPPVEAGVYMAVCVAVADLGDQYSDKFKSTSRKVAFTFEIPDETVTVDGEQKPRQLTKRCTFSVSKRGSLYPLLNAWLNASYSEQELGEIDLFELAGRGCQVRVTVSEDGAHNNVVDVMALPKGVPTPQTPSAPITYDIDRDGFSGEVWDSLPPWMRDAVKKSEQYRQNPPDEPLDMPPEDAPRQTAQAQSQPQAQKGACPI